MCRNGVLMTIGSPSRCHVKHFKTNCGGWNCVDCRPMLEALWLESMELHWSSFSRIGFSIVEVEKFESFRKKVKRAGSNYVRISGGDGLFYVFTDAVSASESDMSVGDALEKFKWCIKTAPCPKTKLYADNDSQFKVITTSNGWRQLHRSETFPEYELIGKGIPTEVIARTISELGQTFEIVPLGARSEIKAMCATFGSQVEYDRFKQVVSKAKRACPRGPVNTNTRYKEEPLYLQDSKDAHADIRQKCGSEGDRRMSRQRFSELSFAMRRN